MNQPKKNHYLPVFYLQMWAGADGRVVRYHRPHNEVLASPIAPKNTGFEEHLYSLGSVTTEDRHQVEQLFMTPVVDTPGANALRALITREPQVATQDVRQNWTTFLLAAILRDPESIREIAAQFHEVLKKNLSDPEVLAEYSALRKPGDPDDAYTWLTTRRPDFVQDLPVSMLPNLIVNENVGQHLINMKWSSIDISVAGTTLLTGDRPVYRSHGLRHPECVMTMPLSPTVLFVATNTLERQNAMFRLPAEQLVRDTNTYIVGRAVKNAYGFTDEHLEFVRTIADKARVQKSTEDG